MLRANLHVHVAVTRRTNGRILRTFQQQCSSVYRSVLDSKEQIGARDELHVPAILLREKSVGRRLMGGCGRIADSVWTLKKSYLPLPGIVLGLSGLV